MDAFLFVIHLQFDRLGIDIFLVQVDCQWKESLPVMRSIFCHTHKMSSHLQLNHIFCFHGYGFEVTHGSLYFHAACISYFIYNIMVAIFKMTDGSEMLDMSKRICICDSTCLKECIINFYWPNGRVSPFSLALLNFIYSVISVLFLH